MKQLRLILKKIEQETDDVKTLVFEDKNSEQLDFKAGQYLNLFFVEDKNGHGKPYTISSSPKEGIKITVKKMGEFSGALHGLRVGDEIDAIGPLGFLTLDEMDDVESDIVFIAGGIGVTPFYSMIRDVLQSGKQNKLSLFYANQKRNTIIFYNELEKINAENGNFNLYHFLSRDNDFQSENVTNRRMSINDIMENIETVTATNFFICGSVKFVDHFWKELKEQGVKEDNIFTEAFFMG